MAAAAPEFVGTRGETGRRPFAPSAAATAAPGLLGVVAAIQLSGLLLRDGAQPAEAADGLAARFLSPRTAQLRFRNNAS